MHCAELKSIFSMLMVSLSCTKCAQSCHLEGVVPSYPWAVNRLSLALSQRLRLKGCLQGPDRAVDLGAADELCPVKIHQKREGFFTRKRPVKRKQEMRQDLIFFERLNIFEYGSADEKEQVTR